MRKSMDDVLRFASAFFAGWSVVHETTTRIVETLQRMGIPCAVAGGLAVGIHGHRRVTTNVDLIVSQEGLDRFLATWVGRGWKQGDKRNRIVDSQTDVSVRFLVAGSFPGDQQPRPISFPDPAAVAELHRDPPWPVVRLESLLELKLASGMARVSRLCDLADALALIRGAKLSRDYADRLDPWVRAKFDELWLVAQIPDDDY